MKLKLSQLETYVVLMPFLVLWHVLYNTLSLDSLKGWGRASCVLANAGAMACRGKGPTNTNLRSILHDFVMCCNFFSVKRSDLIKSYCCSHVSSFVELHVLVYVESSLDCQHACIKLEVRCTTTTTIVHVLVHHELRADVSVFVFLLFLFFSQQTEPHGRATCRNVRNPLP